MFFLVFDYDHAALLDGASEFVDDGVAVAGVETPALPELCEKRSRRTLLESVAQQRDGAIVIELKHALPRDEHVAPPVCVGELDTSLHVLWLVAKKRVILFVVEARYFRGFVRLRDCSASRSRWLSPQHRLEPELVPLERHCPMLESKLEFVRRRPSDHHVAGGIREQRNVAEPTRGRDHGREYGG
ncbi:MAG: hypothetical protein IAG13_19115 [Deltaproteobacteria bacterium]|nr:hypothetical protein [Nannocystaceae bacterium]